MMKFLPLGKKPCNGGLSPYASNLQRVVSLALKSAAILDGRRYFMMTSKVLVTVIITRKILGKAHFSYE